MTASDTIGFGFVPDETTPCFVVAIPRSEEGEVEITEQLRYAPKAERAEADASTPVSEAMPCPPRRLAHLSLDRWLCVENEVRQEFNRRLRRAKLKTGVWKNGANPLTPDFGRELALLCWAIEEADPAQIPNAYGNWSALTPDERQWLYATIQAASADAEEPGQTAWRRALRIALVETPARNRPELIPPPRKEKKERARLDIPTQIAQLSLPCMETEE
jgi:hypothetical protein